MDIDEGHHLPDSRCFYGGISLGDMGPRDWFAIIFNSCADEKAQESWGFRSELCVCSLWLCLPVDSIKTSSLSIAFLGEG